MSDTIQIDMFGLYKYRLMAIYTVLYNYKSLRRTTAIPAPCFTWSKYDMMAFYHIKTVKIHQCYILIVYQTSVKLTLETQKVSNFSTVIKEALNNHVR